MRSDEPLPLLALLQSICALVVDGRARWQLDRDGLQLRLATGERFSFERAGIKRRATAAIADIVAARVARNTRHR